MAWELTIPRDCDYDRWTKLVDQVLILKNTTSWALADLLVFADKNQWLERAIGYVLSKGYRRASIRNFLRVGNRFPPRERKFKLSCSHYMIAIAKGTEAEKWLARAEWGDAGVPWSFDQFYTQLGNVPEKPRMVNGRAVLYRRNKHPRMVYNRPHEEDPFGTFESIASQTAKFIREQTRLPVDQRRKMHERVADVIEKLCDALDVLAKSLPPEEVEMERVSG